MEAQAARGVEGGGEGESETAHASKRRKTDVPPKLSKRKVALLVAYNGGPYQGLQKNPDATTVEEALELAIHRAGGISDENVGTLQKVGWSRAGRTDKGVHAVGQLISLKMMLPSGVLEEINRQLGEQPIRLLGCERVINSFCAHTYCEGREYEYLLPTYVLRASVKESEPTTEPLSSEELARLQRLLKQLEGTHYFHNFTDGKLRHTDKQAQRYIISISASNAAPIQLVPCVSIRYRGQSFLLHQIRKMTALIAGCMRGGLCEGAVTKALSLPRLQSGIPLAPPCALSLRHALFPTYERRYGDRGSVHFAACAKAQEAFMLEHIYPHIKEKEELGVFHTFADELDRFELRPFDEEMPRRATVSYETTDLGDQSSMNIKEDA